MELPVPEFFERDVNTIVADMLAFYKFKTGKDIAPTDPEQLIVNQFAYREVVYRNAGNDAALSMLLRFSRYPIIDFLGELVGVSRLPAAKSVCTLEFTLSLGHGAVIIPQGTRVASVDGAIVFETDDDVICDIGTDVFEITATAQNGTSAGNGYAPNKIATLIDSLAFVSAVANIDTTNGGSDEETDDQLRARIKLAPASFSVAGPVDAYKFFALSANPLVIDVEIANIIPGQVNIYPLTIAVPTPQSVLDDVYAACSGQKVIPLLDTVVVEAPTPVDYSLEVNLTLYLDADPVLVSQTVTEALTTYSEDRARRMGIDIIISQVKALCSIEGQVYDVELTSLLSNLVIESNEFGNCTGILVTVTGYNNG